MSTTARLNDLKRDLARLERKRTGSPRQGRTVDEGGRGREAAHPGQIPSRGWMDVLWRAWGEVGDANLFLIAGGVTSALILTLFSGLAALVSLYGLVFDPSQIETQIGALSSILPAQTQELLSQELHSLVATSSGALGLGAVIGILLALWSASRGMSGIITALNTPMRKGAERIGMPHAGSLRQVLAGFQDPLPHVATWQIATTIVPLIALLVAMQGAGFRLLAAARARRAGGCADGADLYHSTRLRPWIFLPRAPCQRPPRAFLLATDADALRPVAAPPRETPRRLERPRPARRPWTRHILVLPHGCRVQCPRHLASATPPNRQASRNQPAGATATNFSGAVSLPVRRPAHLARGTAQRTLPTSR